MSQDAESEKPFKLCLMRQRCYLCRFLIKNFDQITLEGVLPPSTPRENQPPDESPVPNILPPATFTFKVRHGYTSCSHREEWDRELDLHMCLGDRPCVGGEGLKLRCSYHNDCLRWVPQSHNLTPAIHRIMDFAFGPLGKTLHNVRRSKRICQALAFNLHRDQSCLWKGPPLPQELWVKIASHLVQVCATFDTWDRLTLSPSSPNYSCFIDLTQAVYATFAKLDGKYYVSTLSNSPENEGSEHDGQRSRDMLVIPAWRESPHTYGPAPSSPSQGTGEETWDTDGDIFVADDHLGLLRVVFVPISRRNTWCQTIGRERGVWWRRVPRWRGPLPVIVGVEGRKARWIDVPESLARGPSGLALTDIRWELPTAPFPRLMEISTLGPPDESESYERMLYSLRMRAIDINSPGTIGYNVATDGRKIVCIVADQGGPLEDASDLFIYDYASCPYFWIYMPVNDGEYITDILSRPLRTAAGDLGTGGIVFCTNKNRAVLFGSALPLSDAPFQSVIGPLPCDRPTRVWLNLLSEDLDNDHLNLVGISNAGPAQLPHTQYISWPPQLPYPLHSHHRRIRRPAVYTRCSMKDVTEVDLVLKIKRPGVEIITGMVLTYADGHRESVGCYRLGRPVRKVVLGEADELYFTGTWYFVTKFPGAARHYYDCVVDVSTSPSQTPLDKWPEWCKWEAPLRVSRRGTLEWWYSGYDSRVWYGGRWLHSYTDDEDPWCLPEASN